MQVWMHRREGCDSRRPAKSVYIGDAENMAGQSRTLLAGRLWVDCWVFSSCRAHFVCPGRGVLLALHSTHRLQVQLEDRNPDVGPQLIPEVIVTRDSVCVTGAHSTRAKVGMGQERPRAGGFKPVKQRQAGHARLPRILGEGKREFLPRKVDARVPPAPSRLPSYGRSGLFTTKICDRMTGKL
jgi:hypothetical protein